MESKDPVSVAALTLGELLARFPDGNNNSCFSPYLGILDGPEVIRALSSSEERCLETKGDLMIPEAWAGGVETARGSVIIYN